MPILILDQSSHLTTSLPEILSSADHDFMQASSIQQAITLIQHSKVGIDLILLGRPSCQMSQLAACQALKSTETTQNIPVIMLLEQTEFSAVDASFDAGAIDYLCQPLKKTDVLLRVRSALTLKAEIDRRYEREKELLKMRIQLEETNRYLEKLASLDALTNLMNRRALEHLFKIEWQRSLCDQTSLGVILIDVDYFKRFNDRHGHLAGDECLKTVSRILAANVCRPADAVARFGGEEFIAVLPGTPLSGVWAVAERLRLAVEKFSQSVNLAEPITISLGIGSCVAQPGQPKEDLIAQADRALYWAKQNGRNQTGKTFSLVCDLVPQTTGSLFAQMTHTLTAVEPISLDAHSEIHIPQRILHQTGMTRGTVA